MPRLLAPFAGSRLGLVCAALLLCNPAHAATVTVTKGFGPQGIYVTDTLGTPVAFHYLTVGHYADGAFVEFGGGAVGILDTGAINGAFTAIGPTSLNGKSIHIFVGNGTSVSPSTAYVILKHATIDEGFRDIEQVDNTTILATYASLMTPLVEVNASLVPADSRIQFNSDPSSTPEPSSTMLGLVGLSALLYRRPPPAP